jgi:hypothetical protein
MVGVLVPLLFIFLAGCSDSAATTKPAADASTSAAPKTADVVGKWTGTATIAVNWTKQRQLPVTLDIAADGSATGTVGDAKLVDAKLKPDRGELFRKLGWARDWMIEGKLEGDVIAAEQIHRDGATIVFDKKADGTLFGGVATTGNEVGGKESMKLTAGGMTLRPAAAP